MLEAKGNLWNFKGIHCITTNGFVNSYGNAVMGRGCAKEASLRYSGLSSKLATRLENGGNHVYCFPEEGLITFPVKHVWWNPADLKLILTSSQELMVLVQRMNLAGQLYLPRPGCGNGNLDWKDVKPVIEPILSDQVTVITF